MELVRVDPAILIGLSVEARFDELGTLVPAAWKQLWDLSTTISGRTTDHFTETSLHLGNGRYHEVVGARVDPGAATPPGMVRIEVPGGLYLRAVHTGDVEGIGDTFGSMQDHARSLGHEPDGRLIDDGYTPAGDRPHELYVRLVEPGAGTP